MSRRAWISPRSAARRSPSFDPYPFFLTDRLLEIPCTVDFTGWLRAAGTRLHRAASTGPLQKLRAVGVLRRTGMLNRIMLSPEGNTFEELVDITSVLVADGCRTFTLSFHSPSVEPGHTPYVRTMQDLERFLRDIERFCEFFLSDLDGIPDPARRFDRRRWRLASLPS